MFCMETWRMIFVILYDINYYKGLNLFLGMEDTKTILGDYVNDSLPLGVSYSICRHRLPGCCGDTRDNVGAEIIDNHYLICYDGSFGSHIIERHLAIVDCNLEQEAKERFYNEAKKVAEKIAGCDGNKLVDITLMNNKLSEGDKIFAFGMARKELMVD